MQSNAASQSSIHSNPRRKPAHLSVSLRHSPSINHSMHVHNTSHATPSSPRRNTSEESGDSSGSGGGNAKRWFDRSNKNPGGETGQMNMDADEPPYYMRQETSASSSDKALLINGIAPSSYPGFQRAQTNGSSADDYRSVIDDLTIENRKLKERLRRYEQSHGAHLDKDRLFEVKVHGLPPQKKRELEDTLRSFATSVQGHKHHSRNDSSSGLAKHSHPSLDTSTSHPASSSTSNSRPVDSAYASISASEAKSGQVHVKLGKRKAQAEKTEEQKIASFLHDIPEGLLPKHSPVMSEKAKKKMVVRRLEQLFTGRRSPAFGEHSQPLQQQEISDRAAKADRQVNESHGKANVAEGVREAHILVSDKKQGDQHRPGTLVEQGSHGSGDEKDGNVSSPNQRPTRPLDLDPDRAQVPKDNVEYIRHLGLSTPRLITQDSKDVTSDADGWVYLNLLISMAQLHIFNVTPDFVRSALSAVSAKFQLSSDGRKIRWRGGTEGTKMSSDSDNESGRCLSGNDSELSAKRRKVCRSPRANIARDQQEAHNRPWVEIDNNTRAVEQISSAGVPRSFHYKPLFKHRRSSEEDEMSVDVSVASPSHDPTGTGTGTGTGDSGTEQLSSIRAAQQSIAGMQQRKFREEGPMVFYSGAPFCIDLSGDNGDISTPLHVREVARDGYSNHTFNALGTGSAPSQRPAFNRTDSGSLLKFRPFKDYSKCAEAQFEDNRPKTPELFQDDVSDSLLFSPPWSAAGTKQDTTAINFVACGLGGTQPADHFAVTVRTRRTILDESAQNNLSRFTGTSSKLDQFMHAIPTAGRVPSRSSKNDAANITARLAALRADSPSSIVKLERPRELPVKTNTVDVHKETLFPSGLPPPASYFIPFGGSDDDDDSDATSEVSRADLDHLRERTPFMHQDHQNLFSALPEHNLDGHFSSGSEYDSDDSSDVDDDESIDMLAHARHYDPETIAAREKEFEQDASQKLSEELPLGSSAATADGVSEYSSDIFSV